jgi:crossover junction endodeoxyribonuclease RuvC
MVPPVLSIPPSVPGRTSLCSAGQNCPDNVRFQEWQKDMFYQHTITSIAACVQEGDMIVLGIDPGLATVGYGILESRDGRVKNVVCYDCILTSGKNSTTPERLEEIFNRICGIIEEHRPGWMALEKLFFSRNVTSAMGVAEVRGVLLLAAQQHRIRVAEYTPNQVKQAITGSGRADKRQMQEMVRRLLDLSEIPKPDDVADGLSVALCHLHTVREP